MAAEYGNLTFDEAVEFFRQKINLPTEHWNDLKKGAHARSFVIAGATKADLLTDMRRAVDKAIAQGTTLAEFQKDFDRLVNKHGWQYNGSSGWRSRVIYQTNIRQAYNSGRWQQIQANKANKPYLIYKHGDSVNPRPHHLAWHNLVLPVDHSWWNTHHPQNGWGCKCKALAMGESDLKRYGLKVSQAPKGGTYEWTDKATGEVLQIPEGIDPGFDYNPGLAAHGRQASQDQMDAWAKTGEKSWKRLNHGSYQTYNRPERLPVTPAVPLGDPMQSGETMTTRLQAVLGGKEHVYQVDVDGFSLPVYVNAEVLGSHLKPDRVRFLSQLPELLERPYEVWATFEEHQVTGKVALRLRFMKVVEFEKSRGMLMVANAVKGRLEAWTFLPYKPNRLNKLRQGWLLHGEE